MARSYNKVILVGRTTKTPEVKMGKELKPIVTFNLAVDDSYVKGETYFFRCVAFGKTGDLVAKYVGKGDLILVEGELQINKWVDKSGINKETPQVVVRNVTFLETKKKDEVEEENEEENNEIDLNEDLKLDNFEDLFGDLNV